MAYREFRNELTYAAPEIGQLMPQTMGVLDTAMKIKAQKQARDKSAYDNLKITVEEGGIPQIQPAFGKAAESFTVLAGEDYRSGRPPRPEIKQGMVATSGLAKTSKELAETIKNTTDAINKSDAPFLKKDVALKEYSQLVGDPSLTVEDPGKIKDVLAELEKRTTNYKPNPLTTFNEMGFLTEKVKEYGQKQKSIKRTDKNGNMISSDYTGQFVDENGVPGRITDDVISEVINDPRGAKEYYDARVTKDIQGDLEKIVAGRLEEIPTTKEGNILRNLIENDDPAAVHYLRENPELNPLDKRTDFQRKKEMVEPELRKREKTSIDSQRDSSKTNDWDKHGTNGNVSIDMQFASSFTPNNGPAMIAVTKTGNTPSVKAANPGGLVKNATTGEVFKIGGSGTDFSINDWHIGVVDNKGVPIDIPGNTLEESLNYIKNAPADVVKQWSSVAPIARGTILNKASTIDAKQRLQRGIDALRVKTDRTPEEERTMQELADQLGADVLDLNSEIVQSYLKDMVTNVAYKMDKSTAGGYEARTGIDPTSQKALTPEMKEMKAAIESRIKESKPAIEELNRKEAETIQSRAKAMEPYEGKGKTKTATATATTKQLPTVSSQEEYDALPPGSDYVDANGKAFKKKK